MPSAFCLLHSAFPLVPLLLLWLALGLVGWGAGAQVPGILNNQGRLAINGTSFTGLATFKFALVVSNGASVGTLWSHNNTSVNGSEPTGAGISVSVAAGVFSVGLGDVTVSNMTQEIPPTSLWDEWDEWDGWRMVPCGLGHPKGWTPNLPDQPK